MRSLAAILLLAASGGTGDHAVAPGQRIGKVEIGMPVSAVHAALGRPRGAADRSDGLREEWWNAGRGNTVRVLLDKGATVQISATSPAFRAPDGVSTADDPKAVVTRGLRRSAFHGHGGFGYYYDDVDHGIAWQVTKDMSPNAAKRPFRIYAVIVHTPNRSVIMDDDLIADDEDLAHTPADACVPEKPSNCG